ncbi:MAG TPA: hypothetical protein VM123_03940 [archaeon]|nr:hypothetical protein [archaeon]
MRDDFPVERAAKAYLVIILSLSVLGGYYFPRWLWGLSLVGDYPWEVTAVFALVSLIGLLPPFSRRIACFFQRMSKQSFPEIKSFHILVFSLLICMIPLVFIIRCPLMGDGIGMIYRSYPLFGLKESVHAHFPFLSAIIFGLHNILQFFITVPLKLAAGERSYLVWSVIGSVSAFVFTFSLAKAALLLSKSRSAAALLILAVLTSGTMVLYTGFIEVTVACVSVLAGFLWLALRAVEARKFPWIIFSVFFLYLGLHASAVALVPALVFLVIVRRQELSKKPLILALSLVLPAAAFLFLISKLIDPGVYFSQFIAGKEVIDTTQGAKYAYGLFSPMHFLESINVLFLHSPLNLLWTAWILYAAAFGWRKWLNDRRTVFLLVLLGSFGAMLWLFHAALGVMRDWDIYAPLGLLLPFTAWRLWEVAAPKPIRPCLAGIIAVLLPLALCHLTLWTFTVHSRERLMVRMFEYAKEQRFMSERGKEELASNISIYCVENNYFPDFMIDYIGADDVVRRFVIYRLVTRKESFDFIMRLARRWEDKLEPIDYANIGGMLLDKENYDEALYYLRLSTNKMEAGGGIVVTAASYLANYYIIKDLTAAALVYQACLPDRKLKEVNPIFYQARKIWERDGSPKDSMALIVKLGVRQVFENALSLLAVGSLRSAEQELIAAVKMGLDSLEVKPILDEIRRAKALER